MPPQHTATVPAQPSPAARTGPPPGPAYRSEATRLLCAGTCLDADFRDAVIDELYVHEERVTAPSSGTDTARVLAHALRARRLEAGWAGAVLLLCVLGVVLGGYAFALFLVPCVLLTLAARLRGGVPGPFRTDHPGSHGVSRLRRLVAGYLRLTGWWLMALYLMTVLAAASGGDGRGAGYEPGYEDYGSTSQSGDLSVPEIGTGAAWAVLLIPSVLVVCVALHRRQVAAVLGGDLRPDVFAAADRADEAERTAGRRRGGDPQHRAGRSHPAGEPAAAVPGRRHRRGGPGLRRRPRSGAGRAGRLRHREREDTWTAAPTPAPARSTPSRTGTRTPRAG